MGDAGIAPNGTRDRYFIHAVAHAVDVLRAFGTPEEILRVRDIVARTGCSKNVTFRRLYTLEKTGLIEKAGTNEYRSTVHHHKIRKFKIGYAAQGSDYLFSHRFVPTANPNCGLMRPHTRTRSRNARNRPFHNLADGIRTPLQKA